MNLFHIHIGLHTTVKILMMFSPQIALLFISLSLFIYFYKSYFLEARGHAGNSPFLIFFIPPILTTLSSREPTLEFHKSGRWQ